MHADQTHKSYEKETGIWTKNVSQVDTTNYCLLSHKLTFSWETFPFDAIDKCCVCAKQHE